MFFDFFFLFLKSSICSVNLSLKKSKTILCSSDAMIIAFLFFGLAVGLESCSTASHSFCLYLLSVSHSIFMLTAKDTPGNGR